jgi:hypothetical protein
VNKKPSSGKIILIAETNFVIDIALEQSEECKRLIDFLHKHNVDLFIPEYAFAEADGTIYNIIRERSRAINSALNALRQASRSTYHSLDEFIVKLQQYEDSMKQTEHNSAIEKKNSLAETSYTITFSPESMARSEIRRLKNIAPFKPSDRAIYESILEFAGRTRQQDNKMLFLTRDKEDFNFDFIREELASLNIEIFFSAGECIRRIMELTDTE